MEIKRIVLASESVLYLALFYTMDNKLQANEDNNNKYRLLSFPKPSFPFSLVPVHFHFHFTGVV